ncbi:hypothetical protein SK128_001373 [Halocaridina rubra]|uniref:Uncharacterized protein n=1 Tax=Halocaridina rubra TaxID=373956 RepID=A0AAN8ZUW1_HALRR
MDTDGAVCWIGTSKSQHFNNNNNGGFNGNNVNNFNSVNDINSLNSLDNSLSGGQVFQKQISAGNNNENVGSAKFNFTYQVKQPMYGNFYGHSSTRNGDREEGRYFVLLPDRRLMTVQYVADSTGYHPKITYSSIEGMQMFQNFLFPPEAKGSFGANTFGTRTSSLTTERTTVPPLFAAFSTTPGLRGVVSSVNSPNQSKATTSNTTPSNVFQFTTTTYSPPRATPTPRLTSNINPLTTPFAKITPIRPRSTEAFFGIASTVRPVTVTAPVSPLSSRLTTPRGGRPFLFSTGKTESSGKQVTSATRANSNPAITVPSFNYLPPPPAENTNVNGNSDTGIFNIDSGLTSQNQILNTNNRNKDNSLMSTRENGISLNNNKPNLSGSTGQPTFPQLNGGNNLSGNIGTQSTTATFNSIDIATGYLPPKQNSNEQNNFKQEATGNEILFNNGFSFFESKKLTPKPSVGGQTSRTRTQNPTRQPLALPINRLTTANVHFTLATIPPPITTTTFSQLTTGIPLALAQPQGRTTVFQSTQTPSTTSPSRTTTDHEYDKDAGPAYIPVPGLTSLVVDAPLPAGSSGQKAGISVRKSSAQKNTQVPATTLQPPPPPPPPVLPRAKQLSPFFEFFKIKS